MFLTKFGFFFFVTLIILFRWLHERNSCLRSTSDSLFVFIFWSHRITFFSPLSWSGKLRDQFITPFLGLHRSLHYAFGFLTSHLASTCFYYVHVLQLAYCITCFIYIYLFYFHFLLLYIYVYSNLLYTYLKFKICLIVSSNLFSVSLPPTKFILKNEECWNRSEQVTPLWFWNYTVYWDSFMILYALIIHFFLLLNDTPLYENTTICLSIHIMDIWVVSCLGPLQIKFLWAFVYSLCVNICPQIS